MHAYCTVDDVKDALGLSSTDDDTLILHIIVAVAEHIDRITRTRFVPWTGEKRFDGTGTDQLFIPDLLAVTSLVVDDDTLTSSDYLLYPRNAPSLGEPYTWIAMNPDGNYSAFDAGRDTVSITGRWGYCEETDSLTTLAADITASATTLTAPTGNLKAGHVLLIDSEQMFVTAVSTGSPNDTATVERAQNGTTAASHTADTTIYIYRAPWAIWYVSWKLAANLYRAKDVFGERATAIEELGQIQLNRAMTKDLWELLQPFVNRRRVRA